MRSIKNSKVYVGLTKKEPNIRVTEHNKGSNIWSSHNRPFALLYYEKYNCLTDACLREEFYKSGFGKQIKTLIIHELEKQNIKPK